MVLFAILSSAFAAASRQTNKEEKEKKQPEPFKIQKITQGMGLMRSGLSHPTKNRFC